MFKHRITQDQGFSLVEVLIAVVVLGVAGVALLGGLQTALLSGKKMDDRAGALIAMNAAAQIINTVPYQSCIFSADGAASLPYKSLEFAAGVNNQNVGNAGYSLPEGVEVIAVSGLVGSVASVTDPTKLGQWVDCKSWVKSSTSNPIPTVAQRIRLSVVAQGKTFTRDLLRFYSTTKDIYGGLSGLFRVCAQGSGLNGEAVPLFCGKPYSMSTYVTGSTATFNLSVLDLPAGGSAIYSIQQLSGQGDSIATIAGTSVTVRPNTSNKLLPTYSYQIDALDPVSGYFALPLALEVTVWKPPTITTTSLSDASKGKSYSQTLSADGGAGALTFTVVNGSLPAGLTLDRGSGLISGTPTAGSISGTRSTFSVIVTDSNGVSSDPASLSITTYLPPVISSTSLSEGTAGRSYTATVISTQGAGDLTWSLDGPTGMTISTSGALAWNSPVAGTYSITVTVKDRIGGTDSKTFSLKINSPPVINLADCKTSWTAGLAYLCTPTVTGGTTPLLWSVSGNSGTGLALNTSTGVLSGTPVAGTYTITFTVTDGAGATDTEIINFSVNAPLTLTITSANCKTTWTENRLYTCVPTLTGGTAPFTWSVTGADNSGLSLSASGILSGTAKRGTYTIRISVTDSVGGTASQSYTLTVNPALTISISACKTSWTAGFAYSCTPTATGGTTPLLWSVSGNSGTGLALNTSTGVLSGTPVAGTYTITVEAEDASLSTDSKSYTFTVNPSPVVTLPSENCPRSWTSGASYTCRPSLAGGTPSFIWSITGLPRNSTLTINSTTGELSGTPVAGTFTFSVQDSTGATATALYTLTVNAVPTLTYSCNAGTAFQNFNCSPTMTGGTNPFAFAISTGSLPSGLSQNSATGVISGIPTTPGSSSMTVRATDLAGASTTHNLTLTINPALTLSLPNCPKVWTAGRNYSCTPTRTGGISPFSWTLSSGTLPAGLTLNSTTGVISGTPTTANTYTATIKVQDANTAFAEDSLTIQINPALTVSIPASTCKSVWTANKSYSCLPTSTGGTGSVTWTVSGITGSGLTFDNQSVALTGSTPNSGNYSITFGVTDSIGATASASYTLTVNGAVVLSTSNCASGWTVNRPYSCTPTRTGGTSPFSWSISSGSLPTGLTLNAVSGIISGTPTTSGVSSVTIVVRDDVGSEAQSTLTITINPSVTASVASCATTGNTRSNYSCSPSRTGGTSPFTWSVSGNSGSGLTINASTGVLSGTLPSKAGTYTITITVTDIAGSSASGTFTLTVK